MKGGKQGRVVLCKKDYGCLRVKTPITIGRANDMCDPWDHATSERSRSSQWTHDKLEQSLAYSRRRDCGRLVKMSQCNIGQVGKGKGRLDGGWICNGFQRGIKRTAPHRTAPHRACIQTAKGTSWEDGDSGNHRGVG